MYERLAAVFDGLPALDAELIFVDDGSRDGTLELLHEVAALDRRVRVIGLSRNFGHQAAITAGIDHAAGDAVVLIDGDLQDPPEVIPAMLERWRAGADVVYGARRARKGESAFKRATAKLFYRALGRLSDTPCRTTPAISGSSTGAVADVLQRHARGGPLSARHGGLGGVSPGGPALRARRALRRQDQVLDGEDESSWRSTA